MGMTPARRKNLEAIRPGQHISFCFDLSVDQNNSDFLECEEIVRCLPKRRLACIGQWRGGTVFVKLFFDLKRARIHWLREEAGARALRDRGIQTPDLIHSHFQATENIYLLIFEYIESARAVAAVWNESTNDQKQEILDTLVDVLIEHHRVGILQSDLHLGNFLLAGGSVFTLDGAGIVSMDAPMDKSASLLNLANLLAQLESDCDRWIDPVYDSYASARLWPLVKAEKERFANLVKKRRAARKNIILKKTMRECSAFICQNSWRKFTVYDRCYDSEQLRAFLAGPDQYIADAELIKDGNTSTVTKVTIGNRDILVKRYNIKNWKHALSRAFRHSRAWHSWRNSQRLLFYGIQTPPPIALVENRWGPFRRNAYFLSEYVDGMEASTFFQNNQVSDARKQVAAGRLATLLKKLKRARISHGDLKATNFLVDNNTVSIIDLDSMKEHWSETAFRKAWSRDMRRFFKNWPNHQEIRVLFKKYLGAVSTSNG